MKKIIMYGLILLLTAIITISGTYAYFQSTVEKKQSLLNTAKLDVIYQGGATLNKALNLGTSKADGYNRTVSLQLAQNSLPASANLYIYVEQITSSMATDALNWEMYQIVNGEEKHIKSGTFLDCGNIGETKAKCTNNQKIYMITDHVLSKQNASQFIVYFWLDGSKVDNTIIGATFQGYIGAETENISGILE